MSDNRTENKLLTVSDAVYIYCNRCGHTIYAIDQTAICGCGTKYRIYRSKQEVDTFTFKHKPLEAYLAFANALCVEDAGLDYDAAVAVAKAMHKRGMVIPNE